MVPYLRIPRPSQISPRDQVCGGGHEECRDGEEGHQTPHNGASLLHLTLPPNQHGSVGIQRVDDQLRGKTLNVFADSDSSCQNECSPASWLFPPTCVVKELCWEAKWATTFWLSWTANDNRSTIMLSYNRVNVLLPYLSDIRNHSCLRHFPYISVPNLWYVHGQALCAKDDSRSEKHGAVKLIPVCLIVHCKQIWNVENMGQDSTYAF